MVLENTQSELMYNYLNIARLFRISPRFQILSVPFYIVKHIRFNIGPALRPLSVRQFFMSVRQSVSLSVRPLEFAILLFFCVWKSY